MQKVRMNATSVNHNEHSPSELPGKIRKLSLQLLMLFAMSSSAGMAYARCYVLFPTWTGESEGPCADYCGPEKCVDCAAMLNPKTDYLLTGENGHAWLITEKKKTPIISDATRSFLLGMKTKYAKENLQDPEIRRQIHAEYAAFRKKPGFNNDGVSPARLKVIAKETGLRILDKEPKK